MTSNVGPTGDNTMYTNPRPNPQPNPGPNSQPNPGPLPTGEQTTSIYTLGAGTGSSSSQYHQTCPKTNKQT